MDDEFADGIGDEAGGRGGISQHAGGFAQCNGTDPFGFGAQILNGQRARVAGKEWGAKAQILPELFAVQRDC